MADPARPALTTEQIDRYLGRLRFETRPVTADLETLRSLHLAHLERVPFENLDIALGDGVDHDQRSAVEKITTGGRGGWCFEVNGAFALLLEALGFSVRQLGAAVLLDGPSQVIEHLALEVASEHLEPHLVDVGFGDSFDTPLSLNTAGPQDGGSGTFELIGSPQGTTLTRHVDGVPAALLRFKRVAHSFDDFAGVAASMQTDPSKHWSKRIVVTRRLTDAERGPTSDDNSPSPQRITLTTDRLKITRNSGVDEHPIEADRWAMELERWFGVAASPSWKPAGSNDSD